MMKKIFSLTLPLLVVYITGFAQTPKTYTSSELVQQLNKLNVLGSVLYVAAHPDDENTRLLAYLANEKLYRTGYLSLTRGDGGQNLIGDEQGIDLGLIRTQELLAARRIDGAEQFFSRAYDFGFCKSSEEALATWGHEQILSDVVWVIRKFKPDVIIARFPEDARAGHGHHAASGILAREAFDAAADPARFPEQLSKGVTVWQAKRLLWNTFNFGNTNTQSDDQFKLDVGAYNPLLGKGYGELAALSRSQHKSQGFGVPAQRGSSMEYFVTVKGTAPVNDLMDGVVTTWDRTATGKSAITKKITAIKKSFDVQEPAKSVEALVALYQQLNDCTDTYWKQLKQQELQQLIEACSGLFIEATASSQQAVVGDSLQINLAVNNRVGVDIVVEQARINQQNFTIGALAANSNFNLSSKIFIDSNTPLSQPYWLEAPMQKGSFTVNDQQLIGKAEREPLSVAFTVKILQQSFTFSKPIRYKYTDPVKGELYQPLAIVPAYTLKVSPDLILQPGAGSTAAVTSNKSANAVNVVLQVNDKKLPSLLQANLGNAAVQKIPIAINDAWLAKTGSLQLFEVGAQKSASFIDGNTGAPLYDIKKIAYDHIPVQTYFFQPKLTVKLFDVKTAGKNIGYIPGAGDKVPAALEQMGYTVTMLKESDLTVAHLKQFDAVVTGVRAYNTNDYMAAVYNELMAYVEQGGVLVSQYNTSNFISSVKSKIGPYAFTISRNRITDETATVNFILPEHPLLNYPNKITAADFDGWIQERSIYNAESVDEHYQRIISMKDPKEEAQQGSLIAANYGKGRFIYTGLVFFRELPAGVPGAYRLMANLLAKPQP